MGRHLAGYGTKRAVNHLIKEINAIEEIYKEQNKSFELRRIIVSHCHPDHFSGLKRIREALGINIVLSNKSAEIIKNKDSFKKSFESSPEEIFIDFVIHQNQIVNCSSEKVYASP